LRVLNRKNIFRSQNYHPRNPKRKRLGLHLCILENRHLPPNVLHRSSVKNRPKSP